MIDCSFGSIISCLAQIHCSVLLPRTSAWFVRCTVQFSKNHRSSSDLIILPHSFRFVKCFFWNLFQGLVFIWLSICLCSPLCRATYEIISHLLLSVNWFFLRSFGLRLTGSWLKRVLLYQFDAAVSRVFSWSVFKKGRGFRVQGCGGSFAAKYIFAAKPPPPFLIYHFSFKRGFQMESKGDPPPWLPPNPDPWTHQPEPIIFHNIFWSHRTGTPSEARSFSFHSDAQNHAPGSASTSCRILPSVSPRVLCS